MRNLELYIEKRWGLSNVRIAETLQERGERKVFQLKTSEGLFILKLFHPELTETEIEKFIRVLIFLENNEFVQSPRLIGTIDHSVYARWENKYFYIMEFIEGTVLTETPELEYQLGKAAALLHKIQGYDGESCIDTAENVEKMLTLLHEYEFKNEYYAIVHGLPDFKKLKQGFIHTDICPDNAMKRLNNEIVLIDFDDSGNGSIFIDVGYPLINQFVQFDDRVEGQAPPDINKLSFHFEAAKAFYDGYFSVTPFTVQEKEWIFDGAVFMQLLYMPIFGEEAVPFLWKELTYAMENKDLLMSALGVTKL